MDLIILKRKIDGYRDSRGCIKNVSAELLLELRQTWEHYTGSAEQFRSELGIKIGTLRNLLKASKKLNHVLASADAVGLAAGSAEERGVASQAISSSDGEKTSVGTLELAFDNGSKVIRFPSVDALIDFMRRSA